MSAFTGTSEFYQQFRPELPHELTTLLDRITPTGSPRRLLDIGTGPGLVVEALLDLFSDIVAVDSDADMVTAAEAFLRPLVQPKSRLLLHHGLAEEFTPAVGWQPHLVTFCRVFHWLDQPTVLSRLSEYVAPDGVVAVFSDRSLWTADNPWQRAVRGVVQDFLGAQRRAGTRTFDTAGPPHAEVLRASPFSEVTETVVPVRRTWIPEKVIGYLYSTSFAAPHLFGERRENFESAVNTVLAHFATDGVLLENNAFTLLTARRPSPYGKR
ncbi:class I SAM-dependent methyltransferase [Streptomyces sp. NBC_01304]|uniref:class I SAM-dependent methyltransferase n=1 Tax=Streptomyces sp. NBC_01304 TaxID=2903818 RepID=UPI002E1443B5|nr:methyltransferase domain-containing protein [Streptomyces sp. NBC_01304]